MESHDPPKTSQEVLSLSTGPTPVDGIKAVVQAEPGWVVEGPDGRTRDVGSWGLLGTAVPLGFGLEPLHGVARRVK